MQQTNKQAEDLKTKLNNPTSRFPTKKQIPKEKTFVKQNPVEQPDVNNYQWRIHDVRFSRQ